jgi:hypothetical protein
MPLYGQSSGSPRRFRQIGLPLKQRRGLPPGSGPPDTQRGKESPGGETGASPNEKTSRGTLDAPMLSQSMRRAIIRKRETRNQKY